ncbi:phage head closure protein [Pseudomonas plecoglossicida]|uniref:phage head closure protein n=1 Tax=Pseudomonas plecoglossicida TaxID=70775 RepID=UPI00051D1750|nr:phage head closure protein [Pseudomonas plecoglossicida]KGK24791.1 head-tail adaptor protein [Pseudomonas plecoglossicida]
MRAGPLDRRCTLLRSEEMSRLGGGASVTWVEVGKVWAEINLPSGRIAAVADQLSAVVTAEIRVRFRSTIVAGMRVVCGDTTYLIEAALPDKARAMMRLLCSNVPNP